MNRPKGHNRKNNMKPNEPISDKLCDELSRFENAIQTLEARTSGPGSDNTAVNNFARALDKDFKAFRAGFDLYCDRCAAVREIEKVADAVRPKPASKPASKPEPVCEAGVNIYFDSVQKSFTARCWPTYDEAMRARTPACKVTTKIPNSTYESLRMRNERAACLCGILCIGFNLGLEVVTRVGLTKEGHNLPTEVGEVCMPLRFTDRSPSRFEDFDIKIDVVKAPNAPSMTLSAAAVRGKKDSTDFRLRVPGDAVMGYTAVDFATGENGYLVNPIGVWVSKSEAEKFAPNCLHVPFLLPF